MTDTLNSIRGGKRLKEFDIAKGIGIILMVFGHCCGMRLYNWIYSFHMPLFFLLSGMFFVSGKYNLADFLRRRFWQLLVPLAIFTAVVVGLCLIFFPEQDRLSNLKDGLPGALWFLWTLFLLETVYFVIDKGLRIKGAKAWVLVLFFAFFAKWLDVNSYGLRSWSTNTVFSALPFYCLGHVYADKIKNMVYLSDNWLKTSAFGIVALLVPLIVVAYTGETMVMWENKIPSPILVYYIVACIGSLGVLFVSQAIGKIRTFGNALSFLGRNTIPIIGLNEFLLDVSSKYVICESHALFKILQQIIVWGVCLLVIWFCNKYFKVAVGKYKK